MAEKNIEMNVMNESGGYDVLYPKTISGNVGGIIYPQATITGEDGIVVTGNNGDREVSGIIANGSLVLNLPGYGRWNFSYTKDGNTASNFNSINIDTVKQYTDRLTPPTRELDYYSWNVISDMIAEGNLDLFNVGDVKTIRLNGTAGSLSWNNQVAYATIIGINHNSSMEGNNKIHWQIALNDTNTQLLGMAQMNSSNTNAGGWGSCRMRTHECAQFLNCLPADLRAVVKDTTKWTSAGGDQITSIVSTTDKIFLLSEYEIFGTMTHSVPAERNYQTWYEWYQLVNTNQRRIKYQYNSQTSRMNWWERSPYQTTPYGFCQVDSGGWAANNNAGGSSGFAPCLCV